MQNSSVFILREGSRSATYFDHSYNIAICDKKGIVDIVKERYNLTSSQLAMVGEKYVNLQNVELKEGGECSIEVVEVELNVVFE